MAHKCMIFMITFAMMIMHNVFANDHKLMVHDAKIKLESEMAKLNLTESQRKKVLQDFEDTYKQPLQKLLDDKIKPNLPEIGQMIADIIGMHDNGQGDPAAVAPYLIMSHTRMFDDREIPLFIARSFNQHNLEFEHCLSNKNNSVEGCNNCYIMSVLLNAQFVVDNIGIEILDILEPEETKVPEQ